MSQSKADRPSDEELSAQLMLYAGRLVRAVTREAVGASTEVPTASLRLLSQVDELGPVGIGALAVADRCSQPTMSAGVRYLCQRGWLREGVLAEVVDPLDPTPYWLVSSREPRRLAAAITAAGAGTARDQPSGGASGGASD